MLRDVDHGASAAQSLDPIIITADKNGDTVDLQGYESALIVLNTGISGDTLSGTVYVEYEVEESDDDSVWTDVADKDLTRTVTGNNTGTIAKIDDPAEDDAVHISSYIGGKRYIRVVANVTGTHTNGIETSACVIRGVGGHAQIANPTP